MLRSLRFVLGGLASAILIVALAEILLLGRLSWISPVNFGALLALGLAFLIKTLHATRGRGAR